MSYGPSKSNRGAGNSGEQLVQFKLADAQRISDVVLDAESARRGRKPSSLPRAVGGGGSLTLGTFTGAWNIGETKLVAVSPSTVPTVDVTNMLYDNIPFTTQRRTCVFSGGTLVIIRC